MVYAQKLRNLNNSFNVLLVDVNKEDNVPKASTDIRALIRQKDDVAAIDIVTEKKIIAKFFSKTIVNMTMQLILLSILIGALIVSTTISTTIQRQIKEMGGLVERLPYTRATCSVASASIAGIPPFNGFWSKMILVVAAVQAEYLWLAAITVVVSLVTLISFLKIP